MALIPLIAYLRYQSLSRLVAEGLWIFLLHCGLLLVGGSDVVE